MRTLVTGGRGLLGSAVVTELVRRGHEVTVLQRSPSGLDVPEVLGDITDSAVVEEALAGQEAVVHLAAKVSMSGAEADFYRVNVEGTEALVGAAQRAGVTRFVNISSPSVAHHGRAIQGEGARPADPERARGMYSRTKAIAEKTALAANREGFAVCSIRPHLVWGPGDTQLIAPIVERARAGRLFLIGGGLALIDTTYVDNAADAIAQALDRCDHPDLRGQALVVTNGEPRTVAEIFGRIAEAANVAPPQRSVPAGVAISAGTVIESAWLWAGREGDPPLTAFIAEQLATAHWFDQRHTRAVLDWMPHVSLGEGFRRLGTALSAAQQG